MAKKQTKTGNVISANPDSFISGGLFDEEDAVVKSAVFIDDWDFMGKADSNSTALKLELETKDGNSIEQYWTVGKPDVYWPINDGKWLESTKSGLNSSSNFAIFLSHLISVAGVPLNLVDGDITGIIGLDAYWMRTQPPKKRSVKKSMDDQGREREDKVLVPVRTNALPGEKGKGKGKASAKGKAEDTASADNSATDTACVEAVTMALTTEGGPIPKAQIAKKSLEFLPTDWDQKDKNAAIRDMIFNDGWLGSHPEAWSYDSGIVTPLE